jgi:hypothetical protein
MDNSYNRLVTSMISMSTGAHFNAATIERLEEQSELLLKTYEADFAKDPMSAATESSRSNMIALRHSINQVYGEAAASELANSLRSDRNVVATDEPTG